jgi:adenylate kinase
MASGALCPDDVVVAIVEQRIEQPDARKGFILDGFPRTVAQAEALDRMLEKHHLALEAVIELRVDETALIRRIESRVAEMKARGEPLRADDRPEVLHRRLTAYRDQTAPLIAYYRQHGMLRSVDGMAPIPEVAAQIEKVLTATTEAPQRGSVDKALVKRSSDRRRIGKKSSGRKSVTPPKPTRALPKRAAAKAKSKAKSKPGSKAKSKAGAKAKTRSKRKAKAGNRRRKGS